MLKKVLTLIISLILTITLLPSNTLKVNAEGNYVQLKETSLSKVKIKSGFKFKSGINRSVNFTNTAVFADTGVKVSGAKRELKVGQPVTIKIKDGFKYMDGTTYDIYVEVSTTKNLDANSTWVCKTVIAGDYDCLEISPFNMSVWQGDPYVTFDYRIYILDKDGNDAISTNNIDLTAGSCWTAVNEGARPWGNDNTIYTNIPSNLLEYKTEITAKNKTHYTNQDFWHITNGSYNQLRYYILGHGTASETVKYYASTNSYKEVKANVIKGGYLRNSESGSAEMMFGYFLSAAGNDYVGYYDGAAHSITVDTDNGKGTITYSTNKNGPFTSTKPEYTDVGTYTIYYKVTGDGYKDEVGSHTVTIKPLPISITPTAHNKVYDGNTSAIVDDVSSYKTGVKNENISVTNITGSFGNANVGNGKTVSLNNTYTIKYNNGAKASNYKVTINNPKANITKADIVGVNATPYQGVYDGKHHNITVNNAPSDSTIKYYTDSSYKTEYTDSTLPINVGTYTVYYKVISSNPNYNELKGNSGVNITKKTVYLTPSAESRAYKDNDVSATVNDISATSTGVGNESIAVSGLTGTFDSADAGNNKKVTVTPHDGKKATVTYQDGVLEINYDIVINDTNANIYLADINDLKVSPYVGFYDGESHNITVSGKHIETITYYYGNGCDENNLVESDSCQIIDKKGFSDANTYTVYYKVMDQNANYANKTGKSTVTIMKLPISFTPTADSRVYEQGNTNATVHDLNNESTGVKNEKVTITGMKGTFERDSVGDNKKVTVDKDTNFNVSGSDGFKLENYEITINDTNASITEANVDNLTVKPYEGIYDGVGHNITVSSPTEKTIKYYIGDACNIDSLEGCSEYTSENYYKNVGTYTVYYVLEDNNENYKNAKGSSTVKVNPRTVYVTPSADNKEYDGNTNATINDVLNQKTGVDNEAINVKGLTGTFSQSDAGNNLAVTVNSDNKQIDYLNGALADNYNIIINNTTASIFKKDQTNITVKPYVGYYDGKEHNIEVGSDYALSIKYYADEAHTKEITGYKDVTLDNNGVYTVYYEIVDTNTNYRNAKGSSTVTILPLPISITPTANNKVYDGNTKATVNNVLNYKTGINDESISVTNLSGDFDNPNVGDGKKVKVGNTYTLSGDNNTKLTNYKITVNDTTAKITAAPLNNISSTPYNGIYDGDNHIISVDTPTISNPTITYYSDVDLTNVLSEGYKDVGEYTVYFKVESDNNHLAYTGSNTVTIEKKDVLISPKGTNREYKEGDVSDTIKDLSNILTGVKNESITSITNLKGYFDDDSVGVNKHVRVYSSDANVTFASDTKESNYNLIYEDTTATISSIGTTSYEVYPYIGYYDGEYHNIDVESDYISKIEYYMGDNCTIENNSLSNGCKLVNDYKGEVNVGRYDVYYKITDTNSNYSGAIGKSYIEIKPLDITVTANSYSVEKDNIPSSFDWSITSGTLIEKDKDLFNKEVHTSIINPHTEAGIYTINVGGYSNTYNNYNITYIPGKLTVYESVNNIFKNVSDYSEDFTNASMSNTLNDLLNSEGIITKEEIASTYWGVIWLEISDTDLSSISDTDLKTIETKAKSLVGDNPTIVYFDAMMYKQLNNDPKKEIHDPKEDIEITVQIPDELINFDSSMIRTYKIIRLHKEANTSIIDEIPVTFNESNKTITFKTDKFSTFALAYGDKKKVTTNPGSPVRSCEDVHGKGWIWMGEQLGCRYKVTNTKSR